ncbi:MAG: PTS cellobiose transporter subunit IIC [Atopobiaceae bacterium]|nr:PTS cellobiose transporter subunit IIC [Atopobiaceae bacterium]
MFEFLQKYLMGPMTKISQFRMVRAITAAGMASISFTIVGSMFLVISVIPQAFPVLAGVWAASFDNFKDLYLVAYNASMGIISVYFLVATTYEYAKIIAEEDDVDINPLNAVLMACFLLFMLIPEFVCADGKLSLANATTDSSITYYGFTMASTGVSRLAATGIFTAIIASYLTVRCYVFCVTKHIVVSMPDSVPDGVARSFTAFIPAAFLALGAMVVEGLLALAGTDIYKLISIPFGFVTNLTNSWGGILVIFFLISALWLVGIHGATIVSSLISPIALANLATNVAGTTSIPFAGEFYNAFVFMGGSGSTLGLCLMMCFLAKSDQLKYLGRAAIVPGLFNINEPIIFGLPIVYNPNMAIPFILAPMACASIAYWAIALGIVPPIIVQQPWPTPIGIGGFLAVGADWRGAALALVNFVVASAIYFPFFKAYDKKLKVQEDEKEEGIEAAPAAA